MALGEPFQRYLRLLGFDAPPSGLEGLRALVLQHVCRVPFENVSKLLLIDRERRGRPTRLDEFLDGIEHHDLGGTCYSSNPFLWALLRELGYDADLHGADMSSPNVHTCLRVRVEGVAYHVDAGYGGPFREPMRLDCLPHEIDEGEGRYTLSAANDYQMTFSRNGERLHGYVVHAPPRVPAFFEGIVLDSFEPGRNFMSCLRIVRTFETHSVELHDTHFNRRRAGKNERTTLRNMDELEHAVAVDMAMPRCPIREAVAILERLTGKPFFAETADGAG